MLAGAEAETDAALRPVGSQGIFYATDACTVTTYDDSVTSCRCAASLGGVGVWAAGDSRAMHTTTIDVASRTLLTRTTFDYAMYEKRDAAPDPASAAFLFTVVCFALSRAAVLPSVLTPATPFFDAAPSPTVHLTLLHPTFHLTLSFSVPLSSPVGHVDWARRGCSIGVGHSGRSGRSGQATQHG